MRRPNLNTIKRKIKIQGYENWVSDEIYVKSRCAEQPSVRYGEKLTLCCFLPRWSRVSMHWWKPRVHSDAELTWETVQRHPVVLGKRDLGGQHALQSLAAKFSSLWLGAFSLKVLEFVGSPILLTSLAQRVSSSYELDMSVIIPFLFIHSSTMYRMSYWAYKTLGIKQETAPALLILMISGEDLVIYSLAMVKGLA